MTAGRPRDLEKRKRILDAAKVLFLECGYHGCSMNKIAQKADVTKLTVYNHFQDKESLFTCAIAETCDSLINARPMVLSHDCNFIQAFTHACELTLNLVNLPEALKMEYLLLELASQHNPLAQQFYNASHQKLSALWQNFFDQAVALKFIQPAPEREHLLLLFSLLLGMRHHEVLMGVREVPNQQDCKQIIQYTIQLFLLRYPPKI
ncbi:MULTISPECIES: TetR/AcrR family transcriptional regulator [Acinetobacter]|uniref:TetR family transcriptional regulator n=1 Tax=Acinetobacter chengduensis TaxID=2420890 RepID=A0ABX9TVY0_9GAMM|nr:MULTISPECIES: TetR/AcrR family transcriptional regulator [Acinetobacter]RKG40244.1 TetR/AcrR family transcriptional regulator [Acinetobacter sp. WCHAc060007]RLL21745.1 TetR family transcriptional regulator [Acinetobacter chengduensis]